MNRLVSQNTLATNTPIKARAEHGDPLKLRDVRHPQAISNVGCLLQRTPLNRPVDVTSRYTPVDQPTFARDPLRISVQPVIVGEAVRCPEDFAFVLFETTPDLVISHRVSPHTSSS